MRINFWSRTTACSSASKSASQISSGQTSWLSVICCSHTYAHLSCGKRSGWVSRAIGLLACDHQFSEFIDSYPIYINHYETAIRILHEAQTKSATFSTKLEETNLASLLITPVQRLPRYELLLRELNKHTSDEHPYVGRASLVLSPTHHQLQQMVSRDCTTDLDACSRYHLVAGVFVANAPCWHNRSRASRM
mgnify:CR=1 FL=1